MSEGFRLPAVRGSIFFKVVLIMLALAASLMLMVAAFFSLIVHPRIGASADRLFEEYARVLAASSPDLAVAKELAERHGLRIRYEGPAGSWATDEFLPTVDQFRKQQAAEPKAGFWGRSRRLVKAPDGGAYLFSWDYGRGFKIQHDQLLLHLLLLVVLVCFIAHVVLRRALRPLRTLHEGVARLSDGDLDVVLPNRSHDEFGALTDAFNQMVRRVKGMVVARDQLLLDVSHELRSPLTRMKVALALTTDGEKKTRMNADVLEMETMITELLELERLRDGRGVEKVRQDLLPLLRDVADPYREVPPGVRVFADEATILVPIDAGRMRTVLRNLLENAVKYSLPDSRPVELTALREGAVVVIRVADDGPGIPEADLEQLFEPFFRVDRSRSKKTGGYGLGLSICKRVMEAHDGGLGVRNNPGRGATFTLTLPTA
jgi:signal transduction histidine kinase